MANEENLKPFEKGNTFGKGRPKGSKNRSTIAKKWLNAMTTGINPETGEEESMTLEDRMTLAQVSKAISTKDTAAYKAVLDSAHGQPKETVDVNADVPSINFRELFNFEK
tara:strand:+ start:1749 stop:2078 length:330 start_codon:yes stop_codon:yes gene_type:complete